MGTRWYRATGRRLYEAQWYELKFGWDGTELRGWYRERGRGTWLGGTNNLGLLLYASGSAWPERVKVGQTDIGASSNNDLTMTLLVEYGRPTSRCRRRRDRWWMALT